MLTDTNEQGLSSPKQVITVENGERRVGKFRVQGILSNGLECLEFHRGCWSFLFLEYFFVGFYLFFCLFCVVLFYDS